MNTLHNLIIVVQVVSALAIIGLVLLQHGKGADMGAAFGSGASGSLFGASGSSNFMSKSTAVAAAIFFASTLALASMATQRTGSTGGGLLDKATVPVQTKGSAAIPTAPAAPAADAGVPAPAAPTGVPAAAVPAPAAPAAPATPATAPAPAQPK
ncbi:preprotein translocase subunit SecG [Pseudoduganella namucuonensis]|uniref:Protein-export membrane protein SecG n=1 Tax=Pseudoduganella namucuonensis TaxID=1035707 RepID=A0A1I7JP12_9BURK|nr:preprotein translocase subunit SecG [Pseudoduganella namucuonensis]SFU86937.1 preprotein translocase subunit SecG [Pseudoduganella namucuonensis]